MDEYWLERAKYEFGDIETDEDLAQFLADCGAEIAGIERGDNGLRHARQMLALMNFVLGVYDGRKK